MGRFWKGSPIGRAGMLAAALVAAAACVPPQVADRSQCVPLFLQYDRAARLNPEAAQNTGERRFPWGAEVARLARLLIINDCQTRPRDVGDLAAAAAMGPIRESGAPLGRAVVVHVGAFTAQQDTQAAIALFEGMGLRSMSLGDPRLGRRVYAGPVTTQGGLDALLAVAFKAGFVASYPTEFFRF